MSEATFNPLIQNLAKMIRKHDLSYDQFNYITKQARRESSLTRIKNRRKPLDRLTSIESKKLIHHSYLLKGHRGLLIKTLLLTGCRVSEFVSIDIPDFLPEKNTILIRKAKGGKHRVVPITESLTQELMTHIGTRVRGPLFRSRTDKAYSTRRIQQIVKEMALKAGITKRVHPHLLRHTVATFLLEQGMPLDQIQVFL